MSDYKIIFTKVYEQQLSEIENFIFISSEGNISFVEKFLDDHEDALLFLKQNPTTPAPHPHTGDQSWPFSDGRYRLFFKITAGRIYLLDLIDNRMVNLKVYPNNKMPTFNED